MSLLLWTSLFPIQGQMIKYTKHYQIINIGQLRCILIMILNEIHRASEFV